MNTIRITVGTIGQISRQTTATQYTFTLYEFTCFFRCC